MKTTFRTLAIVAALAAGISATADDVTPVLAPGARKESVMKADAMLSTKALGLPANLVDPFHSEAFAIATGHVVQTPTADTTPVKAGPRTNRDILVGIANGLKPTGNFVMNGEPTLIFGQKRVKAGTTLTINFEGAEYIVEITAIDHTSFSLRLKGEEYTRPIK